MKTRIVSFHCDLDGGTFYADCALRLIAQCEDLGLEHHIVERNYGSDWISNVRAKPTFLLEMYQELQEPFLWVDVDSVVLRAPSVVDDFRDADLASVKKQGRLGIWDSVHMIGHSPRTWDLLNVWQERCGGDVDGGSHSILDAMLKEQVISNLRFEYLPQSLIAGPDIEIGISEEESKKEYFDSTIGGRRRWRPFRRAISKLAGVFRA